MALLYRDFLVDLHKLPEEIYRLDSNYWLHGYLVNTYRELKILKILKSKGKKSAWLWSEIADEIEEIEIPYEHGLSIIENAKNIAIIEKDVFADHVWDISFYHGNLEGLVTSTLTLSPVKPYSSLTILPPWVRDDITDNPYYKEPVLAKLSL